jgi:hypothetical protein
MLIEEPSNIILSQEVIQINQQRHEVLIFRDGKALALNPKILALYKSVASIRGPLGNGLIVMEDIPRHIAASFLDSPRPWVQTSIAGFIEFSNKLVILILPKAVSLFPDKRDALRGVNALCTLDLNL